MARFGHRLAPRGIGEQRLDRVAHRRRVRADQQRTRLRKPLRDLREVVQVRPGDDGRARGRRLEQVVPADGLQAAADERDIGAGVEPRQLAQRVDDEHVGRGVGPAILRASRRPQPSRRGLLGDRAEAFRMTRRPEQQQVGPALAQVPMDAQRRGFLVGMRARGDPRRPAGATRAAFGGDLLQRIGHPRVVLEVAGFDHPIGRRAQRHEAPRIRMRLRAHGAHRRERATHDRREHLVAAQRSRREPRIEHVQRHAGVAAAEQQVRPQLGLHHQRGMRPEMRDEAAHRARQVIGQVDVLDALAPERLHARRAGRRDRGDEQAQVGPALEQRVDQRHRGIHFADGHRMQPQHALRARWAEARIALAPALEVGRLAEAAPDQVVDRDGREHVQHRGIHGAQQALGEVGARGCGHQYGGAMPSGRRLKRRWIHRYCVGASRTMASIAALTRALSTAASSDGKSASGSPMRST